MSQTIVPTSSLSVKRWKSYSSYKDSGAEWLGDIPKHWKVKKLKYVVALNADTLPEDTEPDYVLKYVDISSVDSNGRIHNLEEMIFKNAPSRARRRAWQNDTIISTVRTYLRAIAIIEVSSENLIVSTGFAVLRSLPGVDARFLWRLVQSEKFVEKVVTRSEGVGYPAINPGALASLPVWLPPIPEQRAIATFLDHHTTRINTLIAKKEQLIELLKEKRAALISQAVTKGLDPTVPMKDSGVEWLGAIPEHWEVKQLKFVAKKGLTNGLFKKRDQFGYGVKLINVVDIYTENFLVDYESLDRVNANQQEIETYKVLPGDIFFVRSSLKLEGVAASACIINVDEPTVFECHLVNLRLSKYMMPRYMINYLNSSFVRKHLIAFSQTTTMTTIAQPKLSSLEVIVPPLEEQFTITTYLDQETARIDALISRIQDGIKKLKEYSTALISAAVTGKIDVRDVAEESLHGYLGEEP